MKWKNQVGLGCASMLKLSNISSLVSRKNSTCFYQFLSLVEYSTESSFSLLSFSNIKVFHAKAIKNGSVPNLSTGNYILDIYVKYHDFASVQKLFDEFPTRDVKSWTILISGFARFGYYWDGLYYFGKMLAEGSVFPNEYTFSSVLKCCPSVTNGLLTGKAIHGWIIRNGVDTDVALQNAILDLYVKCVTSDYAERLFETMGDRNVVSWNIMMAANISKGDIEKCLDFFSRLPVKDVSSWNTIIDGCLQHGFLGDALGLLYEMVNFGPSFTKFTFSISLALLSSLRSLKLGRQVHGQLLRVGLGDDAFVWTSLVDMYCKCGQMQKSDRIFNMLYQAIGKEKHRKISYDDHATLSLTWSAMISGYVQNGMLMDALKSFRSMVREKVDVNMVTLTTIVTASADARLLELGQQIHARILKSGCKPDVHLSSSMVNMYAKCGTLQDAMSLFTQSKTRNVVLWTAMISSLAIHGHGEEAVQLFQTMQNEGMTPNQVTFLGVLTACSYAGLVREGCEYFRMMREVYGLKPGVEHFTCMVDLYGRAGRLDDIKNFIFENNISHITSVWTAFLASCQLHKNIEMAKWVSEKLFDLEPSEAAPYVLLSKTCSTYGTWEEGAKLRGLMRNRKVKKLPGQSWI